MSNFFISKVMLPFPLLYLLNTYINLFQSIRVTRGSFFRVRFCLWKLLLQQHCLWLILPQTIEVSHRVSLLFLAVWSVLNRWFWGHILLFMALLLNFVHDQREGRSVVKVHKLLGLVGIKAVQACAAWHCNAINTTPLVKWCLIFRAVTFCICHY